MVPGQTHPSYVLVSHVDQQGIGRLTWDEGTRRYVLETRPKSFWNSTALSEIALWMRKLSRQAMDVHLRRTGHLLVAVAVTWWLLVSHVATLRCEQGRCTPLPGTPTSSRELGRFVTEQRCERVRATLAQVWPQLQREVDEELPPQPEQIELQTTFACQRTEEGTAPQEEGR
jgi:hypothetical protein